MYKLMNQGGRAYIISKLDVIKGGRALMNKNEISFDQGTTIEVNEACGKFLIINSDIKVLEHIVEAPVKKKKQGKEK